MADLEILDPIKCLLSDGTQLTVSKEILEKCQYFKSFFERWNEASSDFVRISDSIDPVDFREFIYSITFPLRKPKIDVKYLFTYFDYKIEKIENKKESEKINFNSYLLELLNHNNGLHIIDITHILTIQPNPKDNYIAITFKNGTCIKIDYMWNRFEQSRNPQWRKYNTMVDKFIEIAKKYARGEYD